MRIGNGTGKKIDKGKTEIPNSSIIPFENEKDSNLLFEVNYPNLHTAYSNLSFITSPDILTTKIDFVDEINDMLIIKFPTTEKPYLATDEIIDPMDQSEYEDLLRNLNPVGLPP